MSCRAYALNGCRLFLAVRRKMFGRISGKQLSDCGDGVLLDDPREGRSSMKCSVDRVLFCFAKCKEVVDD